MSQVSCTRPSAIPRITIPMRGNEVRDPDGVLTAQARITIPMKGNELVAANFYLGLPKITIPMRGNETLISVVKHKCCRQDYDPHEG